MRLVVTAIVSALLLSACANEVVAPAQTTRTEPQKPAPRCYSGDDGKFHPVGQKAVISGIEVVCSVTADGKSGQWMGTKNK